MQTLPAKNERAASSLSGQYVRRRALHRRAYTKCHCGSRARGRAFLRSRTISATPKSASCSEEILRKHLSTRERLPYYGQIYGRFFRDLRGFRGTIFDLGAGVNGFSVEFLPNLRYVGIEGIGQLVKLMNSYFEKQKLNAIAVHLSLFQLEKIKQLIKKEKGKKIVFLFKVLDSLETLKRDYSKRLLLELSSLVDRVIISFATESMLRRKKFRVKRNWILDFISENFLIIDDFEIGGERYISFEKNK